MKILHILYQSIPNTAGSSIRSRDIVYAQKEIGLTPVVITVPFQPPIKKGAQIEFIDGIKYYRTYNHNTNQQLSEEEKGIIVKISKLLNIIPFLYKLYKVVKKENIDILHAHATFFCGISAWIVSILLNRKYVYEVRSLWDERQKSFYANSHIKMNIIKLITFVEVFTMKQAKKVICINESLRESLIVKGIEEQKISVIRNAVNLAFITANTEVNVLKKENDELVFGYIGSLGVIEGLEDLVMTFHSLYLSGIKNRLLIFGKGEIVEKRLRGLIDENHIKNVFIKGEIPSSQIATAYADIDIIVNPRKKNTLTDTVTPLKPIEAMLYRKLVIISNAKGLIEICSGNAIVSEGTEIQHIKRAIHRVLKMSQIERFNMINEAFRYVKENHDWSINVKNYLQLYKQLKK